LTLYADKANGRDHLSAGQAAKAIFIAMGMYSPGKNCSLCREPVTVHYWFETDIEGRVINCQTPKR
jgi:hypothetical protein